MRRLLLPSTARRGRCRGAVGAAGVFLLIFDDARGIFAGRATNGDDRT